MFLLHEDPFDNEFTCIYVNFKRFGEMRELEQKGG